jgi:hypothetical protein
VEGVGSSWIVGEISASDGVPDTSSISSCFANIYALSGKLVVKEEVEKRKCRESEAK